MTWASGPVVGASAGIAVLTSVLASYSWSRRREPGARALALASVIATMWAVASLMQSHMTAPGARIWWYGVATATLLPMVCAVTAFVLAYAGHERHLTRRRAVWALVLPSVVDAILVLTNPLHDFVWTDAVVDAAGAVRVSINVAGWIGLGYSSVLGLLNLTVLALLILRSPSRRGAAGLMFVAHLTSRFAFAHEVFAWDLPIPVTPGVLTVGVPFVTYAVALFGLHVFDPVPAARRAALEQMADGVVVVDADGAVIEANPAAERILGRNIAEMRGLSIDHLLPRAGARSPGPGAGMDGAEIALGSGASRRDYVVALSDLTDETGTTAGRLYMLHDLTEQRDTQERLLENSRALARLTEREHLARDLHDSVGQVLGFASMQAQAIRKRLADGDSDRADAMLARLAEVAQQAHGEVRGLILSLKGTESDALTWSLGASLAEMLRALEANHGVRTVLTVGAGVPDEPIDAATGAQVLRVVQEAVTNARRHGGATTVRVLVERSGERVRLTVEDDGRGFDPDALRLGSERQFGLGIMRERMDDVGGSLTLESRPGRGTRVILELPVTRREGIT